MYYDLHLLSAKLAASMHPIVLVLSVPLSTAFLAIDWCKHFGASVLGVILPETPFLLLFVFTLPYILWEIFHRDNDGCRDRRASAACEELLLRSARLVSYGDNILGSVGSSAAAIC